nr:MAG TPA: hypothetical protein [Caudoviricetes sp.]
MSPGTSYLLKPLKDKPLKETLKVNPHPLTRS